MADDHCIKGFLYTNYSEDTEIYPVIFHKTGNNVLWEGLQIKIAKCWSVPSLCVS